MKKKLLFVIDSLGSGGAEKSLISLLPLIDYTRYDVDLVIFDRGGVYEKYLPREVNIIDYQLYEKNLLGQIKKVLCHALLSPQLRLNKKRHGAEIHWRTMYRFYHDFPGEYDAAIAYQQGVPTFFVATKVNAKKKLAWINADIFAAGYDLEYCRQFYEQMDSIIAVSKKLENLLCAKTPWMMDRLICVYDIINPDVIVSLAKKTVQDMTISRGEMAIVTVGRLTRPKNYLLAVNAARILKDKGLKFKWYFVGEGEMRRAIEMRIKDNGLQNEVILLGFKENPYPYMAKADVYVQTSTFEGFGLTIAEAKILHRPVVSTDFDIVHDQITDGQNGLIAEMTPESVAEKILKLLYDDSLRSKIIHNLEKENNTTSSTEIQKFNQLIES
jgi:glycosyltransferase involved in cell wall biosynthesis